MSQGNRQYRIVSDGIRFKLQCFIRRWWTYRSKWVFMGRDHPDFGWSEVEFTSITEAETAMRSIKAEDVASRQGYKVVAEY